MAGVFISYRRNDAQGWAGRLSEDLKRNLKGVSIFRDIDAIPAGTPFAEFTTDAVGSCDVLIALIGPRWLTTTDETGKRRLDDPRDLTRLEISAALRCGVVVIPTLVDGASLPRPEDLPDDLQPLVSRQSYHLEDRAWQDDVRRLVAVLKPLVTVRRRRTTALIGGTALLLLFALALYLAPRWSDLADSNVAPAQTRTAPPLQTSPPQSLQPTPPGRSSSPDRAATTTPARGSQSVSINATPSVEKQSTADTRLFDSRDRARDALIAAMRSRDSAEKSALAAKASVSEAGKAYDNTKIAFIGVRRFESVQGLIDIVREDSAAANRAWRRAEDAASATRDAVNVAQAKADEAIQTKEPAAAVRAAGAASAAEEMARVAAAEARREEEVAAGYAKAAEQLRKQAVAMTPRAIFLSSTCVRLGQALYQVELSGEATGPPNTTLSVYVTPRSDRVSYSNNTNLICTDWRVDDRDGCTSANVESPRTRWTATIIFQTRPDDLPPVEAHAALGEASQGNATELLQCK